MYIEFIVTADDGWAHAWASDIVAALHEWSDRYQIPYNTKLIKKYRRVTFDHNDHYEIFLLTWNPEQHDGLSHWRLVNDPNNKTTFDSVL
jgi:hypothetical protein